MRSRHAAHYPAYSPASVLCLLALILILTGRGAAGTFGRADLPIGHGTIAFLGDEITYDGRYVTDIAAYFATRYPGRQLEFINLGLPGETVSGLSEPGYAGGKFPRPDLRERLRRINHAIPYLFLFACYGMNDGIYLPLEEERYAKFREGMEWLRLNSFTRSLFLTPPVFDEAVGGHPGYRRVVEKYSQWLLDQRPAGWQVTDLNSPMSIELDRRREKDPKFAFSQNGVQPGNIGHWLMARQVLLHFGGDDVAECRSAEEMMSKVENGPAIFKLVSQKQEILRDAWLSEISPDRPGVKPGLPIEEAKKKAEELQRQIDVLAKPANAQTRPAY